MKIIKIAKNSKLEKVKRLFQEVCEDLREEGITSNAFSISLDINELIHQLETNEED